MTNNIKSTHKKIHRTIKKNSPRGFKKAKKFFSLKYPKLFLLLLCVVLAIYIFRYTSIVNLIPSMDKWIYLGIFIAGFFFSFGFSTPFSVGFFALSQPENIFLATITGGFGAMVGDLVIFSLIKFSFLDEFNKLKREKIIEKIKKFTFNHTPTLVKHYILYLFAGIVIASPLPDEVGVSMLAGLTTINPKKLALISFIFNSIGIFIILVLL